MTGDRECLFLGPEGSFCHQAMSRLQTSSLEPKPAADVQSIVRAVESNDVAFGLVPVENSVDGEVTSTVDNIVFDTESILVREEVVLPVAFDAFVLPGSRQFTSVISHPVALAQCRRFIDKHGLREEKTSSTSEACRLIADEARSDAVALASPMAGDLYGLARFASGAQDNDAAHTKFFLLSKALAPFQEGVRYRPWIAVIPQSNRTGILAQILECFADRMLSIFSLSTRPLRADIGAYCFIATVEGWVDSDEFKGALADVFEMGSLVRVLGSFPSWNGPGVVSSVLGLGGLAPSRNPAFKRDVHSLASTLTIS